MKIVLSPGHERHAGDVELIGGRFQPCFEHPGRAEAVVSALRAGGIGSTVEPRDHGLAAIERIHDSDYISFLATAWSRWQATGRNHHALPTVWPLRGASVAPIEAAIDAALGRYSIDAGTPICAGSWDAAYTSAQAALTGAWLLGREPAAFAVCRPPGHHAGAGYFGGYCFLNNAAIAAQALRDAGASRVSILDVDYHHGNGTQDIFYARGDVQFASIHADPDEEYPYYWGRASERGSGAGDGANLNLPLPRGSDWSRYRDALAAAVAAIRSFAPDALVVSLGLDTRDQDPVGGFRLVDDDFERLGAGIASLRMRTLFVLEGGYLIDRIGEDAVAVLGGFEAGVA